MVNQIAKWLKNNASTILTCIGTGGMIATVALAIKASPEAKRKLDSAKERNLATTGSDKLTVIETIETCGKDYIPMVVTGACTLGCFFGANVFSRKQQASLMSAYAALDRVYQNYRNKTRDIFGTGADCLITKSLAEDYTRDDYPPWDIPQTFYLEGYDGFFERTMEQVKDAEYEINRIFILRGNATFNEFLKLLELHPVEGGDDIGWDEYIGETIYGYRWVDFGHEHHVSDDGMIICSIHMPFPPHSLDEDQV